MFDAAIENGRQEGMLSSGLRLWFSEPNRGLTRRASAEISHPGAETISIVFYRRGHAGVRVPVPFSKSIKRGLGPRFGLLTAHDRRSLWEAWNVRKHARFRFDPTAARVNCVSPTTNGAPGASEY